MNERIYIPFAKNSHRLLRLLSLTLGSVGSNIINGRGRGSLRSYLAMEVEGERGNHSAAKLAKHMVMAWMRHSRQLACPCRHHHQSLPPQSPPVNCDDATLRWGLSQVEEESKK